MQLSPTKMEFWKTKKIGDIKNDMAAKSRKKHKNQISGHVISMGYETEIREFWLFTRLSRIAARKAELHASQQLTQLKNVWYPFDI
jgi:hypothetical protein